MDKENVLVSACLLGVPCRYDGKAAAYEGMERLMARAHIVPFCPEVYGGLSTPRPSAEICGLRVVTKDNRDVTEAFERGAREGALLARKLGCRYALLKEKSPSCGKGKVYSGRFDGTLVAGDGKLTRALEAEGVSVFSSRELERLLAILEENQLTDKRRKQG